MILAYKDAANAARVPLLEKAVEDLAAGGKGLGGRLDLVKLLPADFHSGGDLGLPGLQLLSGLFGLVSRLAELGTLLLQRLQLLFLIKSKQIMSLP